MRCLTSEEFLKYLAPQGISLPDEHQAYGQYVKFGSDTSHFKRAEARPIIDLARVPHVLAGLNNLLPSPGFRILWIESHDTSYPSAFDAVMALRAGIGETRSLRDCRGHFFEAHDYAIEDQVAQSAEQVRETALLVGLVALIMIAGWDAKLLAEDTQDHIEFWEGNVLFYSPSAARIAAANTFFSNAEMPSKMR